MSTRSDDRRPEQTIPIPRAIPQHVVSAEAHGLSVGQIVQMLLKHIRFIVACTVICALISFIYVKVAAPTYEALATIRIDEGRATSLGLNDLVAPASGSDVVPTEIEVLQSDKVAIAALDSLSDADFERFSGEDKKQMLIPQDKEALTPDQEDIIGSFKNSLTVKQLNETQLVTISFRGPDPKLDATIVNHVVAAYLRENFDSRYGSVTQVTTWLSTEMQSLRERAAEAQRKLSRFQEENNIVASPDSTSNTTTDRLRFLNDRLASAEADRIVKQAQMQAAEGAQADPAVVATLYPDPKLQALQSAQGTLYTQYVQLSSKFGPNYSPLAQLKKELDTVNAEIALNVQTVRNRLREEYDASKKTEDMLRSEYQDQTEKAYALNRQQADLAVLEAEVTASRQLYNTLQLKLEQAGIDAGLNGVNTIPVDRARAPLYPVAPKKAVILSVGTLLGLLIGIGAAFIVELSADKVRDLEELQQATGYRPLVMIPRVPRKKGVAALKPSTISLERPLSAEAESYRRLRNFLHPPDGARPMKTLLVTSPQSGEGKTTVAANYAVVLAQTGARVLLVDAELRRPSLFETFSADNAPGLSDFLSARTQQLRSIVPVSSLPTLSLVTSGSTIELPAEALASTRFKDLLQSWEAQFDYVVLKSAPVLTVSDSLPVASWVDGVLLVTRQTVTRLKHLELARDILNQTHARVAGVIICDAANTSAVYGESSAYGESTYAS